MFEVKAKQTIKVAKQGSPATPQFTIFKDKVYTISENSDKQEGTMPDWVAKVADRLNILEITTLDLTEEVVIDKRKKSNKKDKTKKANE